MKIKKNVEIPEPMRGDSKYSEIFTELLKFVDNEDEFTMNVECETVQESQLIYSAIYSRVRNHKVPVNIFHRGADIYFTKKEVNNERV